MKYDLDKIREECLRLAGWHIVHDDEDAWWTHPDRGDEVPFGETPDPTASLDDALPLMRRYSMTLAAAAEDTWNVSGTESFATPGMEVVNESNAALAVCLVALKCAGHDVKQYEVSK